MKWREDFFENKYIPKNLRKDYDIRPHNLEESRILLTPNSSSSSLRIRKLLCHKLVLEIRHTFYYIFL